MNKSKFQHWPKRDLIKNCFLLPNELFQLDLSGGAKLVYAYLLYYEDRETYQCYASYKTIGKAVNMSVNTVKKYVEEFVDKGLVYTENTTVTNKDGKKRNGTLLYSIRPIQEAVDYYNEQMLRLKADAERQRAQAHLSRRCAPQEAPSGTERTATPPAP